MSEINPYAAPVSPESATFTPAVGSALAIDGRWVVVAVTGSQWPKRCVRCNQPAAKMERRKLTWHHPWVFLCLLLNVFVYAVVALLTQKKAEVTVGLCQAHVQKRTRARWICSALMVLGFGTLVVGVTVLHPAVGGLGGLVAVGALIALVLYNRVVLPKRITREQAWVQVGQPFLDSLR